MKSFDHATKVIRAKPKKFGTGSHVVLPKKCLDKNMVVLIIQKDHYIPAIHWDETKLHNGKVYVKAELYGAGGKFWLPKKEAEKIPTRD